MIEVNEKDYKLYRKLLPQWQEAYMGRLLNKYQKIINTSPSNADAFWMIEKSINKDKKKSGVILEISRSKMSVNILNLLFEKAITLEDLKNFSEDFKERIQYLYNRF